MTLNPRQRRYYNCTLAGALTTLVTLTLLGGAVILLVEAVTAPDNANISRGRN